MGTTIVCAHIDAILYDTVDYIAQCTRPVGKNDNNIMCFTDFFFRAHHTFRLYIPT